MNFRRLPSLPTALTIALTLGLAAAFVVALSGPANAQAPAASAATKPALTVKQVLAQSSTWPQTLSANRNRACITPASCPESDSASVPRARTKDNGPRIPMERPGST